MPSINQEASHALAKAIAHKKAGNNAVANMYAGELLVILEKFGITPNATGTYPVQTDVQSFRSATKSAWQSLIQ